VQQQYYVWLKCRNTGKAWVKALIQKVWEITWDMWDHRNKVQTKSLSPTSRRIIEALNAQIWDEFSQGTQGLGYRDYHWLAKPIAHVLSYDKEHKSQWLASINLARERFVNRQESTASSL
jgi:hypothetical protein